ncbi:hypothetical protein [Nostoc flagelliforme]|uniref:hypothetical protein n=1 Tax=Nostoc flagelliforme TaxID=1306274 RepID=UPI0030CCD0B4
MGASRRWGRRGWNLYQQAKASVKQAAMPVLKASEFQMSKAKSSKKVSGDVNESDW